MTSGQAGHWVYLFYDMTSYKKPSVLEAFFVDMPPQVKPLPDQYARMLQYVDCMVDTTTAIYLPNAFLRMRSNLPQRISENLLYRHFKTGYGNGLQHPCFNLQCQFQVFAVVQVLFYRFRIGVHNPVFPDAVGLISLT